MTSHADKKRLAAILALATACFIFTPVQFAHPFALTLGGPCPESPDAAFVSDGDALYATDRTGREVKIAEVGTPIARGTLLQDLGMPAVGSDGRVLFAGAVLSNGSLRWQMFSADPDRGTLVPIELPHSNSPAGAAAFELRVDPRPIGSLDGAVVFSAHQPPLGDAIFKLLNGKLTCLLRTGEKLPDGRVLRAFGFGSLQTAGVSSIALVGYLEPGGQAELLLSKKGITVLAAEADKTPDSARYKGFGFGLPAVTESHGDPIVAFRARTDHGDRLYVYREGEMRTALMEGALCPKGRINFLSADRPGLSCDGTISVRVDCSGRPAIFLVRNDSATPLLSAPEQQDGSSDFHSIGSPLLSDTGAVIFGASGRDETDRIYSVSSGANAIQVTPEMPSLADVRDSPATYPHTISSVTLAINGGGHMAYLGGR